MCQIKGPNCLIRGTIADHIVPIAEGGKDTLTNGRCVCQPCSDQKTQQEATRGLRRALGHTQTDEPLPF